MKGKYTTPMNYPALLGVYLAVNALEDAFVLVDGPDCSLYKAHFIHGRHDLASTLLRASGRHRVCFTNVCSRGVVREHDRLIAERIGALDALPECGLTLVTAMPMCSITGVDYGRVIRAANGALRKPALDLPPESLVGDWLDGYARALEALAKGVPLDPARRRESAVAVVGHLMDRNEPDQLGNLAELRRLLEGLDLDLVSVWPGGQSYADLSRVERAELIVSLPYGRAAARCLAERTGAALVEAELPFGLPKTIAFVRAVAEAAGRSARAETLIEIELSRAASRLEWIVPQRFVNRKAAFIGDPHLAGGFADIAEELGLELEGMIIRAREGRGGPPAGPRVLYEPPSRGEEAVRLLETPLDLLIACSFDREAVPPWPTMDFGFPSYRDHPLHERPFLGFTGLLAFVDRMGVELAREARRRG